jgi:2-haloacid dehalogenase
LTLDYDQFDALTFDCYGTLIDWESGLLAAYHEALDGRSASALDDEDLLLRHARHEAALEAGPYLRYRELLTRCLRGVAAELDLEVSDHEAARFGGSVVDWPAFPDSQAALRRLATRFRLGVLTNCDDDLFAASNERLGVDFDWVVTAEQVGSYKPADANFETLLARVALPPERVLHVAQSLYHDHVPAGRMGLASVWIDRRHDRPGAGATPVADAAPDETYPSMAAFAAATVPD